MNTADNRELQAVKDNIDVKEFRKLKPEYSYSVNGSQVVVRTKLIIGADGYELWLSDKAGGTYYRAVESMSPVLDVYVPDKKTRYCKVRAYRDNGGDRIETAFSNTRQVDLVAASKERDKRIDSFFEALQSIGNVLSYEDLDIAIESLKLAGLEIREREKRRRLEEEAAHLKEQIDKQNRQRQAAAQRAAERREKRRLEHVDKVTRMELPMDYVSAYEDDDRASVHCDSLPDALMMSLDMLGMVDIEFIASVTGETLQTVIETLRGSIYQNPLHWNEVFYKGWETADEYLSGNLMHKYKIAKEANEKYNGYFQNNLTAIEGILDPEIAAEDIYVTLGSPWIPTDVIDEFITYMAFGNKLGSREAKEYFAMCQQADYAVRHDEFTGEWEIPNKTRFRKSYFHGLFEEVNYKVYGTDRMDMLYILENTLNMKTLSITSEKWKSGVRIIDQDETVKVLEKQRYMVETFQNWVWSDDDRKRRLQAAYCRKYGNFRRRIFDGSFLELPGLSSHVKLYDYQKNAVARILFSPNTLLAHEVGSGKTLVMIAAGMELRRLGKSKKNLYVIPNNIISQWETMFRTMYPEAKLLVVTIRNFDGRKRNDTLEQIKTGDFDAILMTYSCFDMLSLSDKYYIRLNKERLAMLDKAAGFFSKKGKIDKKREKIQKTLEKLQETYRNKPKIMPFDELGINTLFLDEAHNYKNVDLESKISRVRGTGSGGSERGNGMMDKVHCVQRMNDGGRVVFATGTPVTNSLSDIFVMQKYLQEGELEFQGIQNFDAWAGMYAEKRTDFEIDVDTNSYHLVTRFSRFCNIPELTATLSSIIDYHQVDKSNGIPELDGYTDSLREGSEGFKDYLREISNRADDIHKKRVKPTQDNMLKLTSDGRKAALDMRLIDPVFGLDPDSKVMRCAENVTDVYNSSRNTLGTQLVFCDIATPKEGFNLYDELKNLLIAMGMPENEIAFIHNADSEPRKKELYNAVREGRIAVLIGSTSKMGHGMNVQKHLAAIHHLDVPWRPSDMVQREGRILRQGNENKKVQIFRYVTKASFDAYSWQLLETKQRFISQVMSGNATMRDGMDTDDAVLNYAEVKALAVGNPKIKRRVEVCNELDRYRILQRDYIEERRRKQRAVLALPGKIERQKEKIALCVKDMEDYAREKVDYNSLSRQEQHNIRETIYTGVMQNQNSVCETTLLTYQGFKVIVPAYMVPRMPACRETAAETGEEVMNTRNPIPYVHLVRNGSYYLEIVSQAGVTARLNHFLDNLDKQKQKYEEILLELETELRIKENELQKESKGYENEIEQLKAELAVLNEELGVS